MQDHTPSYSVFIAYLMMHTMRYRNFNKMCCSIVYFIRNTKTQIG